MSKYYITVKDRNKEIGLFSYFIYDFKSKVIVLYPYSITNNYIKKVQELFRYNFPLLVVIKKMENN